MSEETLAGFAAIIGAPNAGKSTLVNTLVGTKVSIVTHKVQTTRFPVRGVAMQGDAQIVLVDTPGIFAPRRRLDRAMVGSAWSGAEDADVICHVVDAPAEARLAAGEAGAQDKKAGEDVRRITEGLAERKTTAVLALNKVDQMDPPALLALADRFSKTGAYGDIFMVSASTGAGVEDLKGALAAAMPPGPFLYPPDQAADIPMRLMAAEITREKLYLRLHDELPYQAAVETENWEEGRGSARVHQVIYVERDSQKPIVLGKGGRTIKAIGQAAREEMTEAFGRKIHLFLHVKVREGWAEQRGFYRDVGLDFES